MNRFSRGPLAADVQSNFIPLPIDAIARQIDRKQQQYDTTKAQLGAIEDTVLGVRGLSPDIETLKGIQNQYNEEILKGIEEVGGDYSRLGGLTDITARKLKKDLSSGHLAAIQSNYLAAQEIQKKAEDWKSKEGGERGYNLMLRPLQEFKGTTINTDGTYSRISEYTPVKPITLPKTAQEYAKASHDQWLASGEKYLDRYKVASDVARNLSLDKDVISNIREEIYSRYGSLPQKEESERVDAYIRELALNAGIESEYKTPITNTEKLAGLELYDKTQPNIMPYDFVSANPSKTNFNDRFKLATKDVITRMQTDFNKKAFDEEYKAEYMKRYREDMSPSQKQKLQGEVRNDINNKYKEKILRETFVTDPILRDRLITDGKDVNTMSKDDMEKYVKDLDRASSSPVITSAQVDVSQSAIKRFMTVFETSALAAGRVITRDGEEVSPEELQKLKINYDKKDKEGYAYKFGGAVKSEGRAQPFAKGTLLFESNAADTDELKEYAILPYSVNSPEYLRDRALYALNSRDGYTEFKNGNAGTITFQRVVDPHNPKNSDGTTKYAVKKYVNGKEYTKEDGQDVQTVYTIEDLMSTPKVTY